MIHSKDLSWCVVVSNSDFLHLNRITSHIPLKWAIQHPAGVNGNSGHHFVKIQICKIANTLCVSGKVTLGDIHATGDKILCGSLGWQMNRMYGISTYNVDLCPFRSLNSLWGHRQVEDFPIWLVVCFWRKRKQTVWSVWKLIESLVYAYMQWHK